MVNIVNICKFIHEKVLERSQICSTSITEQEISIATSLLALLEDLSNSDSFAIDSEDSLEVFNQNDYDLDYCVELEDDEEQKVTGNRQFSLKYMEKVVDFARPGTSFKAVQHAFPRVTHKMQLQRFREYVTNNGNRRQKLERMEKFVLARFQSARENNLPVHDIDVQRWALSQARMENTNDFTASHHWLLNFKKRNGISSRKVTKFISNREVVDKSII
jgi:Tc5 transposase DNA-binding domain